MAVCEIEGCGKRAKTRGWCPAHYRKWQRYGDPLGSYQHKTKPCARCGKDYSPALGYSREYCSKKCRYVCKYCDQPFEPSSKRQTMCADCRQGHLKKTCERCGRTYRTSKGDQRICSRSCVSHRRGQPCTIEGCDDPIARPVDGWCAKHYAAWQRHGDPLGKCSYKRGCDICGAAFETHIPHKKFCSDACYREHNRRMSPARRKRRKGKPGNFKSTCKGCGKTFRAHRSGRTYCSRECAFEHPEGWQVHLRDAEPKTCEQCGEEYSGGYNDQYCGQECRDLAYTRDCDICGVAFVAATTQSRLCSDDCRAEDARRKSREIAEEEHRQQGKVCECSICGVQFCPLYGTKKRSFCSEECAQEAVRKYRREYKRSIGTSHQARAKYYGVERRYFNERRILVRDGWKCYICGIDTPAELRGTYEDNAPELDHVVPLSRGGPHRKDNVRCCCRHCNGLKADMTVDEFEESYKTILGARRDYVRKRAEARRRVHEPAGWLRKAKTQNAILQGSGVQLELFKSE